MTLFAGAAAAFTLSKPQLSPFHLPLSKRHEIGAAVWKYREGAARRAVVPATGHWLHPTAEKASSCGGGSVPLLPLLSSGTPWAPFAPRAVDRSTFARSKEQFMWPRAVPIQPALCVGSFLAEPGFSHCPTMAPPDLLFSQCGPRQQLG